MKTFYVGIKGLVRDPSRGVLLLHKPSGKNGFWELPGGRIDGDESFESTLIRELNEELPGIKNIEIGELLGAFRVSKEYPDNTGLVLLYFDVQATLPDSVVISDEHDDFTFFNGHGDMPEPINPVVRGLLEKIDD